MVLGEGIMLTDRWSRTARGRGVPGERQQESNGTRRRWPFRQHRLDLRGWLSLGFQAGLVAAVQTSDDAVRGFITPENPHLAVANAIRLVQFEADHGFWIEPGMQEFFRHAHHVLGLTIIWAMVIPFFNNIYELAQTAFVLLFAVWLYRWRAALFPFIRDIFFFATAISLVGYELYPTAPPRLTPGLRFDGHPYHFVDTVFRGGVAGALSFNKYSAMPSLHIVWALIITGTLIWALRPLLLRLLSPLYLLAVAVAVVVTGNHYLLDGAGSLVVAAVALIPALAIACCRAGGRSPGDTLRLLHRFRHGMPAGAKPAQGAELADLTPHPVEAGVLESDCA
jgi:hypothetical protein